MEIQFIASFAVITPEPTASRGLYLDALGLPLESAGGDYFHGEIEGSRHFGVWPLREAAQACFGADAWPQERPTPQASVEFEVGSAEAVEAAAQEVAAAGYQLLHGAREEPWGQTVARLQTLEGVIVGISFVPSMHD